MSTADAVRSGLWTKKSLDEYKEQVSTEMEFVTAMAKDGHIPKLVTDDTKITMDTTNTGDPALTDVLDTSPLLKKLVEKGDMDSYEVIADELKRAYQMGYNAAAGIGEDGKLGCHFSTHDQCFTFSDGTRVPQKSLSDRDSLRALGLSSKHLRVLSDAMLVKNESRTGKT